MRKPNFKPFKPTEPKAPKAPTAREIDRFEQAEALATLRALVNAPRIAETLLNRTLPEEERVSAVLSWRSEISGILPPADGLSLACAALDRAEPHLGTVLYQLWTRGVEGGEALSLNALLDVRLTVLDDSTNWINPYTGLPIRGVVY